MPTANAAPAFAAGTSKSVSVAEGTTAVGTYTATDPEGAAVTYALAASGDHASFEVTSAGVLSFRTAPDHETKASYSVTVTASDGSLTGTIVLTVTVSDVDEAPTFADGASTSVSVAEGTTAVGTFTATDPEGAAVTYALDITTGDHASFTVTSAGVLSFKVAPDYEAEDSYSVTVTAADATSHAGSITIAVTVTNVDEAPVFADGSSVSVSVAENSTAVGTYTATDPEGAAVTYALAASGDHGSFEVTSAGVLSFKVAPDHEAKDSYSVTVTASAGSLTGTIAVTVTVDDVDEPPGPPTGLKVDAAAEALAVSWVAPAAAAGVPAVSGYDVQYRLRTASSPQIAWADWVSWPHGDASAAATIGALAAGSTYQVRVRATNPEGGSAWVGPLAAVPTANAAPAFAAGTSKSVSVAEGATAVGTYTATDPEGKAVTYGLDTTKGDHASFEVTTAGVLSFKTAPDHETKASYSVTVTASDGTLTGTIVLTVTVSDVDEAPTFADGASTSVSVAEGTTAVGTFTATDPEGAAVTYALDITTGDHASFTVTSAGVLSFKVAPDYEAEDSYSVTVTAADATSHAGSITIAVTVTNVDEAPVFADGASVSVSVAENSTAVGTYTATDPEGAAVTYALAASGDHGSFEVTSAGVLSFKVAPDHEAKDSYSVTVTASAGSLTGTIAVTVTVDDVDEPPGPPTGLKVDAAAEALAVSWVAPAAAAGVPAVSGYEVQYRLRTSADGATTITWADWVSWPHDDASAAATITGLKPGVVYGVRVRATNPEGEGAWVGPTGRGADRERGAGVRGGHVEECERRGGRNGGGHLHRHGPRGRGRDVRVGGFGRSRVVRGHDVRAC